MTHYLLNDFDVCFVFAKPCAKRMAKNVATEMRDDNGFSAFFLSFCSSSLLHHLVIVSIALLIALGAQPAFLIYKYESSHATYCRRGETSFLLCLIFRF